MVFGVKIKRIVYLFEYCVLCFEFIKIFIEKNKYILVIVGVVGLDLLILIFWFIVDIFYLYIDKFVWIIFYLECLENFFVMG